MIISSGKAKVKLANGSMDRDTPLLLVYLVSADFLFFKVSYMLPMVYHRGEFFHHPL